MAAHKRVKEKLDETSDMAGLRPHVPNNWSTRRHARVGPRVLVEFRKNPKASRLWRGRRQEEGKLALIDEPTETQGEEERSHRGGCVGEGARKAAVEVGVAQLPLAFGRDEC